MANRTACCLALSFLLGILYGGPAGWPAAAGMAALCLMVGAAVLRHYREGPLRMALLRLIPCVLLFGAGAAHIGAAREARDSLSAALEEGSQITLRGKVSQVQEKEKNIIYTLTDVRVFTGGTAYPCEGVLVYGSGAGFFPGNLLEAHGTYEPFQVSRNEGNFNEREYYQSKEIEFRLFSDGEKLLSGETDRYAAFLSGIKKRLSASLAACMSRRDAGVMADITLGEKSLMDEDVKSLYQEAGISHILAISGLHVSLFGMGLFRLLQKLCFPPAVGAVFSAAAVYSFGMLAGMEVSTARAVCMFFLMMAARMSGYSYDTPTALAVSAGLQALENPFVLWNTGFLLSYAAVLGAGVAARILGDAARGAKEGGGRRNPAREGAGAGKTTLGGAGAAGLEAGEGGGLLAGRVRAAFSKIRETMFLSLCIQLTVLPLSLYFYFEAPAYGIFVNGCVLPLMGLLLILGVAGALAGCVSPWLGRLALAPAGWILALNEGLCRLSLRLPGAVLTPGKPPVWLIALYYVILGISLWRLSRGGKKRWLALIAAAFLALFAVRAQKQFEIDVLDVGQGDGIFLQSQEGDCFFVDGGSSDVKQVGEYRILPFLKARGVRSIKAWIVSHADADHVNGLEELLEEGYPVQCLIVPEGMRRPDEAEQELLSLARQAGCEVVYASRGMRFGTETLRFTILSPEEGGGGGAAKKDRNAESLVASFSFRGFTGILTGDIGEAQERRLLEGGNIGENGIGEINFYKAAHHGSNGSNSREFLDALSPDLAAISCGEGNRYGHPGKEAVSRMREAGARLFCTIETGQLTVVPEDGGIRVKPYL